MTPSREPIAQHLEDLLALRQVRRNASGDAQKYGGLGGLILDGEPGVGKSELVLAVLRAKGYQEVHDFHRIPNVQIPDKPFYRMPVSMQLDDKKKLLLKAFHEGAVVVIDEINSSPMMERFMNALLMGQTPDGKRPNKPGFLIIGTQNPVTMAGRRAPSTALSRRLITEQLPTYPEKELQDILITKGVTALQAQELVTAFNKTVEYAKAHYLSPSPTFRDLLRLADNVNKGNHEENNYLDLVAAGAIEAATKYLNIIKTNAQFTDDIIDNLQKECQILANQVSEVYSETIKDLISNLNSPIKRPVDQSTYNKNKFVVLSITLQQLKTKAKMIAQRKTFIDTLQAIKELSLGAMDKLTHDYCQKMQNVVDNGSDEFLKHKIDLEQIKSALSSPQMQLIKVELERLREVSNSFFTTSKSKTNYSRKITNIVNAVTRVPLEKRMDVFSDMGVRKALAAHRNTGQTGNARSFTNIAEKLNDKNAPERNNNNTTHDFKNRRPKEGDPDSSPPVPTPAK